MARSREWLTNNYLIDIGPYDAIIGYRADDSYFAFARAFLNNTITLEQLSIAMKLGRLGEQFVLKSSFAFDALEFKSVESVDNRIYYPKRKTRDEAARDAYLRILEEESEEGLYIRDLMRGADPIEGI